MNLLTVKSLVKKKLIHSPKLWGLILVFIGLVIIAILSLQPHTTTTSNSSSHGFFGAIASSVLGSGAGTSAKSGDKKVNVPGGSSSISSNVTSNSSKSGTKSNNVNLSSPSSSGTTGQSSAPAQLKLSSYNVTLGNSLLDPNNGNAQITVSSNTGPISQPTHTYGQLAYVFTSQSSSSFQDQWTFTVSRETVPAGGSGVITFTARTESGITLTAQLNVVVTQIPSFYTTQGPLTKVVNSDGSLTITAHITINPSANFGNPIFHVCDDTNYRGDPAADPCDEQDSYTRAYNGNNELTLTKTVPSTDHYLSVEVWADGGIDGNDRLPWSF